MVSSLSWLSVKEHECHQRVVLMSRERIYAEDEDESLDISLHPRRGDSSPLNRRVLHVPAHSLGLLLTRVRVTPYDERVFVEEKKEVYVRVDSLD